MKLTGLAARVERLEQRTIPEKPSWIVGQIREGETEAQARQRTMAFHGVLGRSRVPMYLIPWEDRDV